MPSIPPCPRCGSTEVTVQEHGRKAGGLVGAVAGAIGAIAATHGNSRQPPFPIVSDSPVLAIGQIAAAIVAGLVGAAAGGSTGATAGGALDDHLLDTFKCEHCSHSFTRRFVSTSP